MEVETIATYRYDPGVVLANNVLAGWDSTEVEEEEAKLKEEKAEASAQWRNDVGAKILWGLCAVVAVILLGLAGYYGIGAIIASNAATKQKHNDFIALHGDEANAKVAKLGDKLEIANADVSFGGIAFNRDALILKHGPASTDTRIDLTSIPNKSNHYYGDVDLFTQIGVPATIHVIQARNDMLIYTVTQKTKK
jgi:hypothetical protein